MKKQNWILGIIISLGISLIASTPRLIRMDRLEISFALISICYNFFFCISCWLVHDYLINQKSLQDNRHRVWLRAAIVIGVGLMVYVYDWICSGFTDKLLQFPENAGSRRPYILLFRGQMVSGLFYFIAYYLKILSEKQKNNLEIAEFKQAQMAANLSSIKEQLSPHFLFNTLNTLSTLTQEKGVKDYVSELANVYRYVLQYKDIDIASLQQELTFIESYLYILKTRLENAIIVDISVDTSLLQTKIPPLTLQLLIENAVKHNIASSSRQLRIGIKNSTDNFLVISNNVQPKTSVRCSTGIGLDNVMQRYHLLFNKEIIIEKTDTYFTVKLPII